MAEYLTNANDLTSVANAIRSKTGGSQALSYPSEFVAEINGIVPLPPEMNLKAPSSGTNSYTTNVLDSNDDKDISVDVAVTSNGDITVDIEEFEDFVVVDLLKELIERTATMAKSPATSIGNDAFNGCTGLTDISFPEATSIGDAAFQDCTGLTGISFPKVTSIGTYAFYRCTGLTDISFPEATSIGNAAFSECYSLTDASFPKATSIGVAVFSDDLIALVLGNETQVCSLTSAMFFPSNTTVYVPDALVNSYKSASNWSDIASQIKGISEIN